MNGYLMTLALRLLHVVGGIFWVGAVLVMVGFVAPTARASGPEGGRFMRQLLGPQRFAVAVNLAGAVTLLSGLALYARDVSLSAGTWPSSRAGITFGIGGVLAILGGIIGGAIVGPVGKRMSAVGRQIAQAGGPPAPEQMALIRQLSRRLQRWSRINATLLVFAAVAMALARYV